MKLTDARPVTVGWKERVDLPDWGIRRLRAKADSGARTSSIHVSNIEKLSNGRLRFEVVTRERPTVRTVMVEAEEVRQAIVKPSPGVRQTRPVVETRLRMGPVQRRISVTLVCRRGMLCRMLLGRAALSGLLVDPGRPYLLTRASKSTPSVSRPEEE